MSKLLLEQVEKHRKEIKHEVITYGLSELITMHKAEDIQISPDYQRTFRWNRDQQTLFIESLILEIPFPPVFFYENDDGRWELLDGLQRLSTIIKFMGSGKDVPADCRGASKNEVDWHDDTQNILAEPLQLRETEYLSELGGFTFVRLPTSLQLNLKRARIQIYVLKRETHSSYKYEVFKRLNSGGEPLSEQEVRNCATRLFDNKFPDFIQKTSELPTFRQAIKLDDDELRAARADELTLRFFTMKNWHDVFKHDVGELLTEFMKHVASQKIEFDYDQERGLFEKTWAVIAAAVPNGAIFRPRGGGMFSPTVFELVSLAVAFNIDDAFELEPAALAQKLDELVASAKAEGLTGAGSNSRKKTRGRVDKARSYPLK
nr:DUF262 domain-containing protein [Labilithrix luteola]